MMRRILLLILGMVIALEAQALTCRVLSEVDKNALLMETQKIDIRQDHSRLVHWIPVEYWKAGFYEQGFAKDGVDAVTRIMAPYFVLAIVDVTEKPYGELRYSSEADIRRDIRVYYRNAAGKRQRLTSILKVDPGMAELLDAIRPEIAEQLGAAGQNMQFLVFSDFNEFGERLVSPYEKGQLQVEFGAQPPKSQFSFDTPLNALFQPRHCADGREAEVSWVYCPWDGKRLSD